jgi:hypothetical protein
MRNKQIFENLKVPVPRSELKEKVVLQADLAMKTGLRIAVFSRRRSFQYILATGIIGCFLFLIFWNPPIPGSNSFPIAREEISANDQTQLGAFSARLQYHNSEKQRMNALRALEGELL